MAATRSLRLRDTGRGRPIRAVLLALRRRAEGLAAVPETGTRGVQEGTVIDQLLADVWAAAILMGAVILLTLGTLRVFAEWRPRKR